MTGKVYVVVAVWKEYGEPFCDVIDVCLEKWQADDLVKNVTKEDHLGSDADVMYWSLTWFEREVNA